jgi:hypothetical protein
MKIAQDAIFMDASRAYLENKDVKENLRVWVDQSQAQASAGSDHVTISRKAEELLEKNDSTINEIAEGETKEASLKQLVVELLMGGKFTSVNIEKVDRQDSQVQDTAGAEEASNGRQGWGAQYDYQSTYTEKEDVSFNAKGLIKTSDGKQIAFTLKLDMNREYIEQNSLNIRAGDAAIDPLVLNFDGKAAELTDLKFSFDLNADGVQENISMPTSGRGFLALDRNGDGMVTDGSELFGPRSGNGFAELRRFDADGNDWIDENDEIFKKLRVMTVDGQGSGSLNTLKEKGVGAIYLGSKSTQFDVRSSGDSSLQGRVRSTGIYLKEDGTPGTVQQLDLMA